MGGREIRILIIRICMRETVGKQTNNMRFLK